MDALAVYQDKYITVAQSAELHVRSHVVFVECEGGGKAAQDVLQGTPGVIVQHLPGYDFSLDGNVFQKMRRAGGRDDGLRNRVLQIRLR